MCMGCTGGSSKKMGSAPKTNSYTPKKLGGGNKGSYTPRPMPSAGMSSGMGRPSVRMSFGGRKSY